MMVYGVFVLSVSVFCVRPRARCCESNTMVSYHTHTAGAGGYSISLCYPIKYLSHDPPNDVCGFRAVVVSSFAAISPNSRADQQSDTQNTAESELMMI